MKRVFAVGLAVLIVVALAAYTVMYNPGPALVVTEGSITGVLEGNFANYTNTYTVPLEYFNATTYANQSGGLGSTLTLRLLTATNSQSLGIFTAVYVRAEGEFASNLNLTGLTLVYNKSGTFWDVLASPLLDGGSIMRYPSPNITWPGSTNVTYSGPMITSAFNTTSGALTPTLANETGKGPFYEFAFSARIWAECPLDPSASNDFLGFRATVTGRFTPDVSVGILLQVLDVP